MTVSVLEVISKLSPTPYKICPLRTEMETFTGHEFRHQPYKGGGGGMPPTKNNRSLSDFCHASF